MANHTLDDYCYALRTQVNLIRDTNATLTSLSNSTMDFWKSSRGTVIRIEVLVVVITVMQLFLAIFGSWRRRSRNFFIQKGVLVAYTLSSSLISYTLGSMQSSAVKSSMYTLWAISVYLFGCADSITAYSLTDNSQLTRQIYQSALGFLYAYWFLLSITLGSFWVVPLIFLMSFAYTSVLQRLGACQLASSSWHLNKKVADYMYQEHTMGEPPYLYDPDSLRGYHYLVDWPLGTSKLGAPTSYVIEFSTSDQRDHYEGNNLLSFLRKWWNNDLCPTTRPGQIIDIEKVWQNNGGPLLSPDLKDACLSFSLFHLLRRRFFGFECGESSQPKTHDFVFKGLLAKKNVDGAAGEAAIVDYDRVFKVIEVELAFMYDFFFTKYAAIYYGVYVSRYVLPLSSATLTVVTAFLTAGGLLGNSNTTAADVGITVAILVCISVLQVVQVLYYWTTIWGRVSFACQRIEGEGCCMGLKELLVHIGVLTSTSCWYHNEEKLGQYSLLESVSNISNQSMVTKCLAICENGVPNGFSSTLCWNLRAPIPQDVWRVIRKPGEPTELLPAVKKALVQSLERTQGKLTNGESSLSSNTADDLLWACKLRLGSTGTTWSSQKEENQVCVILTWHIATCYCDKELASGAITEDLKEHHEVATTLSKYTAYLVGFQPKLLPGHHYDTWFVLDVVAEEATILQSEGIHQGEQMIYRKGLRLGEQLKNMEAARCWKVLADFWAEMLLYLAPSDNVKEHVECLAKGGELITHLWALLTHAGILDRGKRNNVTNDMENPGDGPSYTYSCTRGTNQPPTTTVQLTKRDVGETRDSGTDKSDPRELSYGAALRLRQASSYLDKCAEGAASAASRAMNKPALRGNCAQIGMMVQQRANPLQNGEGAPNNSCNGLSEIEDVA